VVTVQNPTPWRRRKPPRCGDELAPARAFLRAMEREIMKAIKRRTDWAPCGGDSGIHIGSGDKVAVAQAVAHARVELCHPDSKPIYPPLTRPTG